MTDKEFTGYLITNRLATPYHNQRKGIPTYIAYNGDNKPSDDIQFNDTTLRQYSCIGWTDELENRLKEQFDHVNKIIFSNRMKSIIFIK